MYVDFLSCVWRCGKNSFETLYCEAERYAAPCRSRQPRLSDDHVVRVFTRLMLHGRVCKAVHFVTDQARGKVLKHSYTNTKSGKRVLDVLREKHPPPGVTSLYPALIFLCLLMWMLPHPMLSRWLVV